MLLFTEQLNIMLKFWSTAVSKFTPMMMVSYMLRHLFVDSQITSVGSANLDFRSFKLNFEANAFGYDS